MPLERSACYIEYSFADDALFFFAFLALLVSTLIRDVIKRDPPFPPVFSNKVYTLPTLDDLPL